MAVADAKRRAEEDDIEIVPEFVTEPRPKSPPLIEGRRMVCPRCERRHDILQYVPMQMVEKFADETNPIYKCPSCKWIFSPAPHALEDFR